MMFDVVLHVDIWSCYCCLGVLFFGCCSLDPRPMWLLSGPWEGVLQ